MIKSTMKWIVAEGIGSCQIMVYWHGDMMVDMGHSH